MDACLARVPTHMGVGLLELGLGCGSGKGLGVGKGFALDRCHGRRNLWPRFVIEGVRDSNRGCAKLSSFVRRNIQPRGSPIDTCRKIP